MIFVCQWIYVYIYINIYGTDKDYCIDPAPPPSKPPLVYFPLECNANDDNLCQECEGDCDNDDDCVGDLICFKRNGFTPVPGCEGAGKEGMYTSDKYIHNTLFFF